MWQLSDRQDAAAASHHARLLLSQLSQAAGFSLAPSRWSARGTGLPRHPDMPACWHASISHKQGRIVVALGNCPVGVDLEIWQPRHTTRLDALIQLLPEPAIQQLISHSANPQRSFYKVYTLHEALFKLAHANKQALQGLFETRLAQLQADHTCFGWQWENPDWILSLVTTTEQITINLPSLSQLSTSEPERSTLHTRVCAHDQTNPATRRSPEENHPGQIDLSTAESACSLFRHRPESPAIRRLFVEHLQTRN